jgi:ABC-type Fe3+/spermidine/putrescine transport system ATPase subunit
MPRDEGVASDVSPSKQLDIGMPAVEAKNLTKSFSSQVAVGGVSFALPEGSFLSLLGPSGCGKTTTLRMLAGLERPDGGEVRIAGKLMSSSAQRAFVPPHKRRIGFVHQSYGLWPHMDVYRHLLYPLQHRKVSREDRDRRVREVLAMVRLTALAERYPSELSGGQQQRVSLGRALVQNPDVLLLDEPLSNLDAALRGEMGVELRRLQRVSGSTAVYVTHDRLEALSLSDFLIVMSDGLVVEFGRPQDIYELPATEFSAQSVSGAVALPVTVIAPEGDGFAVNVGESKLLVHQARESTRSAAKRGGSMAVAIRPDRIHLQKSPLATQANSLSATVTEVVYYGSHFEVDLVGQDFGTLACRVPADQDERFSPGDAVQVLLPREDLVLVEKGKGGAEPAS